MWTQVTVGEKPKNGQSCIPCEKEAKSDQEYAVEETSIKHWHDPPTNVADIASTHVIRSEKGSLEDITDLTIVSKDKFKNAENSGLASSNDT